MKRTLIAAAVLVAASGSAFAAPQKAYLFNATLVGEAIGVEGLVGLYPTAGCWRSHGRQFRSGTCSVVRASRRGSNGDSDLSTFGGISST